MAMEKDVVSAGPASKLKNIATSILRKIRKLEYKNVKNIPGYEKTDAEYCALKSAFNRVDVMIKNLMSYEYGNRLLKMLKDGIEKISDKSSLNVYKNRDVFEELSKVSKRVSTMSIDSEGKRVAENFSDIYKKISESKKKMNERLKNLRLQLKEKRVRCTDIDRDRKKVKNMRYDLEILLQDGGYSGEIRETEKKEFAVFSSDVLESMIEVIKEGYIGQLLSNLAKEHSEHMCEISEILKSIK